MKVICPYCGSNAVLADAFEIYHRLVSVRSTCVP